MLRLNISQTYAQIGINTKSPFLAIETTPPRLTMQQEPAVVEISGGKTEVLIDMTDFRASLGLKNIQDFTRDVAQEGHQAALEAIGEIAQEGDRLARIDLKSDPFVEMAVEKSTPQEGELVWSPLAGPKFDVKTTPLQFNVKPAKLTIQSEPGTVNYNFERGTVEVYLRQQPSIKMWTTGSQTDLLA